MGVSNIERIERIRGNLVTERESWLKHWKDLADYLLPRKPRWLTSDRNSGRKKHRNIIDNTAMISFRNVGSGMMSGITSPARPWFRLGVPDPELNKVSAVREWLDEVASRIRGLFQGSNIYSILHEMYRELAVFGTSTSLLLRDRETRMRAYAWPVGSYVLAADSRRQIDTAIREFSMTARQLREEFGLDVLSTTVRSNLNGNKGAWHDVIHAIVRNDDFEDGALGARGKRWLSVYYEKGKHQNMPLRERGFSKFPILAPRWGTTGEDVYGSSPGMDVLGDTKALQWLWKKDSKALDKIIDPPLVGPPSVESRTISQLPGDVTIVDEQANAQGGRAVLHPLHEITGLSLEAVLAHIREHQRRIRDGSHEDVFRLMRNLELSGRDITATEINARREEQLLALGPVLDNLNDDMLDPLVTDGFEILRILDLLPPIPDALQDQPVKVEYISILAQAQKLIGISGIDRIVGYVGNVQAFQSNITDKIDYDLSVDEIGEMLGVPAAIIRDEESVEQIRQQRAAAIRAQQALEAAQAVADVAETASRADTNNRNLLTDIATPGNIPGAA